MTARTLGTNAATSLVALDKWVTYPPITGGSPTPQEVGSFSESISDDADFGVIGVTGSGGIGLSFGQQAVLTTATTNTSTSLTSVVTSNAALPITQIHVGDLVLGDGIPSGTFVTAISGTTVTLSRAATASQAGTYVAFVRAGRRGARVGPAGIGQNGLLYVPNRGVLKVLPGDVVARDNTGFPILVSGQAIGYAGTDWTFT